MEKAAKARLNGQRKQKKKKKRQKKEKSVKHNLTNYRSPKKKLIFIYYLIELVFY